MTKLPKAPEHEIQWAMITTNCEYFTKKWIEEIINLVKDGKATIEEAAEEIYENVRSLGYSEGYDSRCADDAGEGW